MKKIFAALIVVVLALTSVFALVACGEKTETELAIENAQTMTLAELEAASKAEMEANPSYVFNADSLTSGIEKALKKFAEKYDWITYGENAAQSWRSLASLYKNQEDTNLYAFYAQQAAAVYRELYRKTNNIQYLNLLAQDPF